MDDNHLESMRKSNVDKVLNLSLRFYKALAHDGLDGRMSDPIVAPSASSRIRGSRDTHHVRHMSYGSVLFSDPCKKYLGVRLRGRPSCRPTCLAPSKKVLEIALGQKGA